MMSQMRPIHPSPEVDVLAEKPPPVHTFEQVSPMSAES